MKKKHDDRSFAEKYLGITERPKMSSWAREQLAKEQGLTEEQIEYLNNLPTREEILKANKKSQKRRNFLIILVVIIIIIYEYSTGSSLFQQIMGTPQQTQTTTTEITVNTGYQSDTP